MKRRCGCCEGIEVLTPARVWNRPGLSAIQYRAGTHGTFFETMEARLSGLYLDILTGNFNDQKRPITKRLQPLKELKTRDRSDPAIALLDAWATVGDVLTFYQERIANEGYLRTATERCSILELARLIGYKLRPGVSASVYLAYTLDDNSAPVTIPIGTRSQSVPEPGETAQFFETAEPLKARVEWNDLKPRMSRPPLIFLHQNPEALTREQFNQDVRVIEKVYFEGTTTNLNRGDALLFVFGEGASQQLIRRVEKVNPDSPANRTEVVLQALPLGEQIMAPVMQFVSASLSEPLDTNKLEGEARDLGNKLFAEIVEIVRLLSSGNAISPEALIRFKATVKLIAEKQPAGLFAIALPLINIVRWSEPAAIASTNFIAVADSVIKSKSLPPASRFLQAKSVDFGPQSDALTHLYANLLSLQPGAIFAAWANAEVNPADTDLSTATALAVREVHALRATASLFGYNAPLRMVMKQNRDDATAQQVPLIAEPGIDWEVAESSTQIHLDQVYKEILPESFVVIRTPAMLKNEMGTPYVAVRVQSANAISRTAYGISARITRLDLHRAWQTDSEAGLTMADIRGSIVHAQSEALKLADEPLLDDIGGNRIETGRFYDGLEAGRWLIVTGERTDIPGTSGVRAAELVMLAGVQQTFNPARPGEKTHTTLILENRSPDEQFQNRLAYTYKRDTVKVYGNVEKATNGETRNETLGSGDAAQAFQQFALKQPPLTYVSAATVEGIESTLRVRVNDVEWHESDSLAMLASGDHRYVTVTDDSAKTTLIFGDGKRGARPPTGVENITAVYRSGIGKGGNVKAGQITLAITRPLGVKEVINLLRAAGGADKESRDMARRNAPLAVMALDRLVSTEDYADFARTFAGIAKASAVRLSDGQRQVVHLTIAGVDDIPIDVTSDLYQNLRLALHNFGDPYQPVQVEARERLALVLSAQVHILPDYLEEKVEPLVRQSLLDRFSFDNRQLGQPAFLSEVISVIQRVAGVAYVDVDEFAAQSKESVGKLLELKTQTQARVAESEQSLAINAAPPPPNPYVRAEMARVEGGKIKPAQLAFFLPDVPETLILNLRREASA
jgi:predicted phage baseplate assembly protein